MLNIGFLACSKVELWDLKVIIAVNGEEFQSRAMTHDLDIGMIMPNIELFSFTINYLNFMFLDRFLFMLLCKNTHTHTHTHTHTDAHKTLTSTL